MAPLELEVGVAVVEDTVTWLVTVGGEELKAAVEVGEVKNPVLVCGGTAVEVGCGAAIVELAAAVKVGAAAKLVQNPSSSLASLATVTSMVAY